MNGIVIPVHNYGVFDGVGVFVGVDVEVGGTVFVTSAVGRAVGVTTSSAR